MKDFKIYFVLFLLVFWIAGSTYWLNTKICVPIIQYRNNVTTNTYENLHSISTDNESLTQNIEYKSTE